MKTVEPTYSRLLKVWWGFMWRGWLLMLPIMVVALIALRFTLDFPKPGQPPNPPSQAMMRYMLLIWLTMMVSFLFMQLLALRWTLKVKWSDFKLSLEPIERPETSAAVSKSEI